MPFKSLVHYSNSVLYRNPATILEANSQRSENKVKIANALARTRRRRGIGAHVFVSQALNQNHAKTKTIRQDCDTLDTLNP